MKIDNQWIGLLSFLYFLGHQLVAKTFGGAVGKSEKGWMIGNYKLAISNTFDWMQPTASETGIFHFNKERVEDNLIWIKPPSINGCLRSIEIL